MIFAHGAQVFHEYHSEIGIAFIFEGMVNLFVRIGEYEQAARLIGWADATRKRTGDPRPLSEEADVDRIITTCLLKSDEEIFPDAYDEGQSMTTEQVMLLAEEEKV